MYKLYLHLTSSTNWYDNVQKEKSLILAARAQTIYAWVHNNSVTNQVSDARHREVTVNLSSNAAIK